MEDFGASKRPLAIRGHHSCGGHPAQIRITVARFKFGEEFGFALFDFARGEGFRVAMDDDNFILQSHRNQPQPQTAAEHFIAARKSAKAAMTAIRRPNLALHLIAPRRKMRFHGAVEIGLFYGFGFGYSEGL